MAELETEKIEAQKRFEALPENLKKEMLADKNVQTIISICQDYSIPEEKVKHVALLVGEVFLGYIKPEEVAHELTTYFDIDLQKANFIEIELKQKLFNSLKPDLDKIYNPIKAGGVETAIEEVSPAMIKFEAEKQPTTTSPLTKPEVSQQPIISPLTIGNIPTQPQPTKIEIPATPKTIPVLEKAAFGKGEPRPDDLGREEAPFIIQTKVEAVKPAMPQFSKIAPSLNLKVDPSIIQKTPIIKPISVRLETTEPVQEKKFQMPVIAGQKIFSGAPQPAPIAIVIPKTEIKPIQTAPPSSSEQTNLQGKPMGPKQELEFIDKKIDTAPIKKSPIFEEIKIPVQQKVVSNQPQPTPALSLKQISEQKITPIEQKTTTPEPAKVVHYSTFKTDLTHLGTPKKPESKKDDFINLNTFMRVSGNTVDLRSTKNES